MTVAVEPISIPNPPAINTPDGSLSNPAIRRGHSVWWTILLLTILAGVLRFSFIDKPPLWGDDAATWSRICGTYSQMLGSLEDAGFGPLHYELYWWIKSGLPVWFKTETVPSDPNSGLRRRRDRVAIELPAKTELTPVVRLIHDGVTMTPLMMRLVPAIAGTLMVPAMYWLASQLVNRRAALIAAGFVACSAYMLNYSRDAKMYMHLWLMCVVHVACLFWWLRVRTRHSWYCWVASGIAMVGLQTIGFFVLGIEVLIVLTTRRGHWTSLCKLLLLLPWLPMVLLSPLLSAARADFAGDRGRVGRFFQKRFERFGWPPVVFFLLGALVIGSGSYGYYKYFNVFFDEVLPERVDSPVIQETGIGWVETYNHGRGGVDLVRFTASAFLYNWEWPRYFPKLGIDDTKQIAERTYRLLNAAGVTLGGLLLLGVLPWPRRWVGERGMHVADGAWWRSTLLLTAWLVVPAYAFYCASVPGFFSPIDWIGHLFLERPPQGRWPNFGGGGVVANVESWRKAWAAAAPNWHADNVRWGVVASLVVLAGSGAFFSSNEWPARLKRAAAGVLVVASLLVWCGVIYLFFDRPFKGSVWMPRYLGFTFPAFAMGVAVLLSRLPTRWIRWPAVGLVLAVNLAVFAARVFAGSEPPVDRMARDVLLDRDDDAVATYYVSAGAGGVVPGAGAINGFGGTTMIARYYLATLSNRATTPLEVRGGRRGAFDQEFQIRRINPVGNFFGAPTRIVGEVKGASKLRRLIVWERMATGEVDLTDRISDALAPDWKRASETIDQARDHWTWRERGGEYFQYRRREYVRRTTPTTRP